MSIPIRSLDVSVFVIPTDYPEADGTLEWDRTTMVVVEADAGNHRGFGYTYADTATATLIRERLIEVVRGRDVLDIPAAWHGMVHGIRNLGRPGIASMAIAAVDTCLWDLKAKLLGLPLVKLLGQAVANVPVYGSGGFTSYPLERLQMQLAGWTAEGISRVKMKIGRDMAADRDRVRAAREAIGESAELMVDANGALRRKQALAQAERFADWGVTWFEEPVSSDDLKGLRLLCDRAPAGMDIAAGEYGYDVVYFRRMLAAGAVDVLQADVTRCAGISGLLEAAAVSRAHGIALSAHCAPSLHVHPCCSVSGVRHLEYFHDHVRIEQMLLDGAPQPQGGMLHPDLSRPGSGLELKR